MRKNQLSRVKRLKLIEHFVVGTTAHCAAELVGVNRKTVAYYYQRLREIILRALSKVTDDLLDGVIELMKVIWRS